MTNVENTGSDIAGILLRRFTMFAPKIYDVCGRITMLFLLTMIGNAIK